MKILFVCGQHNYGDAQRGIGYEYGNMRPALAALGHEVVFLESWDKSAYNSFADLNERLLGAVVREKPDLVFVVLMNYEIWIETLQAIRDACGTVVINWAPDDSWKFRESSRFLLPYVDLHCTTYPAAKEAAKRAGYLNVLLSQWAANSAFLSPPQNARECGIAVSFVGTAYGNRRRWIEGLGKRGIDVQCFGHGWPNGAVSDTELRAIIRDSVITLNFADSGLVIAEGRMRRSRQIKARTFEAPGAGGFLLTETAEGLQEFYAPDTEMVTFSDIDELEQKINYFLQHTAERDAIAMAAYKRTESFHTYERRLKEVIDKAERVRQQSSSPRNPDDCMESPAWMDALVHEHATTNGLRVLKSLLVGPASLLLRPRRGARAARKLFYECYWRLVGERTYRASGLPGRLFYRES